MSDQVWINGEVLSSDEAKVSPFDHGLLTGDGVFETLMSYDGKVAFAIRRHWERLQRSGQVMGLRVPSQDEYRKAIEVVLEKNDYGRARVRTTLTGGPAPLGSERGDSGPTFIVAAGAYPPVQSKAHVVVVPFRRNEQGALVNLKTTSYGENVVALSYAQSRGGTEAVFANTAGLLCEGTGSNIFIVVDGKLVTPPVDSGCLPGITRALVLEICEEKEIPVQETSFPVSDLDRVSEAFLTSSLRDVQAIESLDGHLLPVCQGDITEELQKGFMELREKNQDP